MLDFLLEYSKVAKSLEPPVTLNELLRCYCETPEKFTYVVGLLERLPLFAGENLKLSNCLFREDLPYDSLIGLTKDDLSEFWAVMDYLDFPKNLMEKLKHVIENMTSYEKYTINWEFFNPKDTSHWSYIGDLEGLKYAHAPPVGEGCSWNKLACAHAARGGHLDCLKYAHEHGCPWDEDTCKWAAQNGHLECLKYAHTHGCPWNELTCMQAARNGELQCLRYAHEHWCSWNENTCANAAYYGRLECLKYAHEPLVGDSCPWDESTCTYAAASGSLECLKYAHENGCPWHMWTCLEAAKRGHLNCLEYARAHGCPE